MNISRTRAEVLNGHRYGIALAALVVGLQLAPAAAASESAAPASTATAKLRASDIGAKTRTASRIKRVKVARTFYKCGQIRSKWYPGNLVTGVNKSAGRGKSWFASYPDQVRSWQKGRQNSRTRSAIRNLRSAYPAGVRRACSHLNPKPRALRAKKSCAVPGSTSRPSGGLRLVSLKRKKALVACRPRLVGRKGHTAGADTADLLQVVAADNTATSAVTRGGADISRAFHGPNGLEVLLFNSPAQISDNPADPKCWVAKVNVTTGVPTCLLDETKALSFDPIIAGWSGYWDNPYVRFDEQGNIYVTGDHPDRSQASALYRINPAGEVTNLLESEGPVCTANVSVFPNGSVVLNTSPTAPGDPTLGGGQCNDGPINMVKIAPTGAVSHLCDGPTRAESETLSPNDPGGSFIKCSSSSFGVTSGGGTLMGGIPNYHYDGQTKTYELTADFSIGLLDADATTLNPSVWMSKKYASFDNIPPAHAYEDIGCGGDEIDACTTGNFANASLLQNGSTVALLGVVGGTVGASTYGAPPLLAELSPTPRLLNLPHVKSPFLARALRGTNAYAVAGINKAGGPGNYDCSSNTRLDPATDKCGAKEQLAIYDREVNDDVPVDLPYDMGIYDMQSSGDGKTLYIAARRVSDGKYVIGQVDIATTALTITSEADTPLNSFTVF